VWLRDLVWIWRTLNRIPNIQCLCEIRKDGVLVISFFLLTMSI
jgi:hypothetical protein